MNFVETIRRARQNEIDERLRGVRQEVIRLTSNLQGEGGRRLSVGRCGADTQGDREGWEGGMSTAEMRKLLSAMQDVVAYQKEKQQSAWAQAQGLSDDLPPGYALTPPSISSGPTIPSN